MRTSGRALTAAALSALALTAVFNAPASAGAFGNEISVQKEAHISEDGTVTLSGTYRCHSTSPVGAVQVAAGLRQGGIRLGISGENAVCDGAYHEWSSTGSLRYTPGITAGPATAEVQLTETRRNGPGIVPVSVSVVQLAEHSEEIELIDHR
ncbi:DUF6299 family protein [Streptomyces sp. NPDC003038]|uniref:DUF6299 family protein n=1 Tax=unclassified Streptomyces TaxID=2593676 RepID=UPI0033B83B27